MVILRATAHSVKRAVSVLRTTPDGRRVVSLRGEGSASVVEVWDGESGDRIRTLRDSEGLVVDLSITADGEYVTTWASPGKSWTWEVATGRRREAEVDRGAAPSGADAGRRGRGAGPAAGPHEGGRGSVPPEAPTGPEASERRWPVVEGLLTLAWDQDGRVRILEEVGGPCLFSGRLFDPPLRLRGTAQGGRFLVGGDWEGPLLVWDLLDGDQFRVLDGSDIRGPVVSSPDGAYLATRADRDLAVWTVGSWDVAFRRGAGLGELAWLTALAVTPDAAFVISGSSDGLVSVWEAGSGECQMRFPADSGISALAARRDLLAVGTEAGTVYLLRLLDVPAGPSIVTAFPSAIGGYRYRCGDCGEPSRLEDLGEELVECARCGRMQRVVCAPWAPTARR